jgi:hypothetical protein
MGARERHCLLRASSSDRCPLESNTRVWLIVPSQQAAFPELGMFMPETWRHRTGIQRQARELCMPELRELRLKPN